MLKTKIGWLDILANDTHEYYFPNNTGGPSIKVGITVYIFFFWLIICSLIIQFIIFIK